MDSKFDAKFEAQRILPTKTKDGSSRGVPIRVLDVEKSNSQNKGSENRNFYLLDGFPRLIGMNFLTGGTSVSTSSP